MKRLSFLPTLIAFAGAALLVYWTSTARPLWVDEEMLLLNVRDRGFLQLAGPLWLDQSAPLGWLVLERLILLTFGTSEPAVRLLTIVFGMATLATAVQVGRRWMTPLGASVLVALCAVGEWIVFFTLELKHYSADTFGALLIPSLAAWALDARQRADRHRRITLWWIAAALAPWFSNGALFVTPLCAVVLVAGTARHEGIRSTLASVAGGLLWLASFGADYALVLRHAAANEYLRNYWAFAYPPVSSGLGSTLNWIVGQLAPFVRKPVGSGLPFLFWLAWIAGVTFAVATHKRIGCFIATVPVSALALALFHVIPPFERLALWVVPSMYVGVGLSADAVVALVRLGSTRTPWIRLPAATAAAMLALIVSADVVWRGVVALAHRPRSNYGLDDRSSIRWLLAQHRAGDAVMATHYGLAALWWYGRINVAGGTRGGTLPDGSPVFEITSVRAQDGCHDARGGMDEAIAGHARAAVYLGFRMNVEPVGFDNLVLHEMGRRGVLDSYKEYAEESRLAVFDLRTAPSAPVAIPGEERRSPLTVQACVGIKRAVRW